MRRQNGVFSCARARRGSLLRCKRTLRKQQPVVKVSFDGSWQVCRRLITVSVRWRIDRALVALAMVVLLSGCPPVGRKGFGSLCLPAAPATTGWLALHGGRLHPGSVPCRSSGRHEMGSGNYKRAGEAAACFRRR